MTLVLSVLDRPPDPAGEVAGSVAGVPLTRFVGRADEIAAVAGQVRSARLVTLTGPGGNGKTRLALAVSARLRDGGTEAVSWVELAELDDPALLEQAIAAAVGVTDPLSSSPGQPLLRHLRDHVALLVLDNCEHLVAAAATFVSRVLRACPELRVLATSRESLGVAGETTWAVNGLSLPAPDVPGFPDVPVAPDELAGSEAVQLFVDRARLVLPGFAVTADNAGLVARLCRRLDGMPLAIELAAARLRVLPLRQMVDRLDDVFSVLGTNARDASPRHHTMRATLDWSYDLLPEPERRLLARLSVFRGGFTVAAAEAVATGCGGPVLDLLARLVEKSLVQVHTEGEDERYRLLEVVRQYAEDRLGGERVAGERVAGERVAGEPCERERRRAGERHASHYLHLAERAEQELMAGEQQLWLDRLHREQDNLRAALTWARRHDPPTGVRLAGALGRYCRVRGNYAEGRDWLRAAVAALDDRTPQEIRAKVLIGLGMLEFLLCEYDHADARLREALDLYRPDEEPRIVATVLAVLGGIAREQGRYPTARAIHEQCLEIWRELDDPTGVARSIKSLGFTAWLEQDYARAESLSTDALRRFRALEDGAGIVGALVDLGAAAYRRGNLARARALLRESLALSEQLGSREGTAWSLEQLGLLASASGDHRAAVSLLRTSLTIHYEVGDRCRTAGVLEALSGELVAVPSARVAVPSAPDVHHPRAEPAGWAAARLLAAAEAVRTAIGAPVPPCDRAETERRRRAVEEALAPDEFATATVEGQAISLDQAVSAAVATADALLRRDDGPADPGSSRDGDRADRSATPDAPRVPAVWVGGDTVLRVHALGRSQVELAGRPLGAEDWTYAKPRELFYFLLTRPKSTKAEIGLALWPDASAKELRNSFHTGLKHLRRALGGQRWVRFADGGYAIEGGPGLWYDVEEFERAAHQALEAGPGPDALSLLDAAAGRYPGHFLIDTPAGGWADTRREQLRRRHEHVMLEFGRLLGLEGRYGDAVEIFARLVDEDSFLEAAHRGLMRCHAAMGNRTRAIRQYQALVETLGTEAGTSPAPETTALYLRLRPGPDRGSQGVRPPGEQGVGPPGEQGVRPPGEQGVRPPGELTASGAPGTGATRRDRRPGR